MCELMINDLSNEINRKIYNYYYFIIIWNDLEAPNLILNSISSLLKPLCFLYVRPLVDGEANCRFCERQQAWNFVMV